MQLYCCKVFFFARTSCSQATGNVESHSHICQCPGFLFGGAMEDIMKDLINRQTIIEKGDKLRESNQVDCDDDRENKNLDWEDYRDKKGE